MMKYKFISILGAFLILTSGSCSKTNDNDDDGTDIVTPVTPPEPEGFKRYVKDIVLSSRILREHVKYSVYLPADYDTDTDTRYSVVYMLHGLGDNNNSWNGDYLHANSKINELESKGLSKMIYVFPQGFSSYYCNYYDGSYNYMDMFVEELIPAIDQSYRTIADKEHRSITGYSMGGFGAIALAEKHPEMFIACAPLSMSVRTDWQYLEESQSGWNNQWGVIFGGEGKAGQERLTDYYKQHCPLYYFNQENKEQLTSVNWYLICGDDEANLLYANDALHCILRDNGYTHEYRVVDGGHSSSVWNPALDEVLPMFDHYMNSGNLWDSHYGTTVEAGTVKTEPDGVFMSTSYKDNNVGAAMYLVYKDINNTDINAIMAAMSNGIYDSGYILLPCDIAEKSLSEWISFWDTAHPNNKRLVLGIGEASKDAFNLPKGTFKRSYYINPNVGDNPTVSKNEEIYFAGTDEDLNYNGMDALYYACKKNGAKFEYRIVNASGNPLYDILNSINAIKKQLFY
ncbi:MAG: esterase family protein [Bacteroidales bacterium]|nr:esterase family protein [Bacteroidales bacterium]